MSLMVIKWLNAQYAQSTFLQEMLKTESLA